MHAELHPADGPARLVETTVCGMCPNPKENGTDLTWPNLCLSILGTDPINTSTRLVTSIRESGHAGLMG